MTISIADLLFVAGASLAIGALWAVSWQAGMVGTGLGVMATGVIVRVLTLRMQKRRRQ